ncbi:MAG: hypothetical protein ABIR15_02465 [Chitinophagaceae bacterium]
MKPILFCLMLFGSLAASFSFLEPDKKGLHKNCYVDGRFLYTSNGEKIILRGINKMNVVTEPTGVNSFPEIAKTGANSVRIMWAAFGGGGIQLDTVIGNCIKNKCSPLLKCTMRQAGYIGRFLGAKRCGGSNKKIPEIPVA